MKLSFALIVVLGLVAISNAKPAKKRVVYYKQSARYSLNPVVTHARFTQGGEATLAGETSLKEYEVRADATLNHEVGEVHPDDEEAPKVELDAGIDDDVKVPLLYNAESPADETNDALEEPVPEVAAEKPAQVPVHSAIPKRFGPSSRKVRVELEQPDETQDEDEEEAVQDDDSVEEHAAPIVPQRPVHGSAARRPAAGGKPSKPLPAGNFFSTDFGGASGSAIAIANSLSTGERGNASSHATAYGAGASHTRAHPGRYH